MPLIANLEDVPHNIRVKMREVLSNEFTIEAQMAKIRQQKIAAFYANHRPRAKEGIGEQLMAIDPFILNYFNEHHRTNFYEDEDFRQWVRKRHDWARVTPTTSKIQFGYVGVAGSATRKRYSRNFTEEARGAAPSQPLQTLKV